MQAIPLEGIEGGVRPAPPQRIAIPDAGVETVIDPVGTRKGEIEVPRARAARAGSRAARGRASRAARW